jgi:hypothetical protein
LLDVIIGSKNWLAKAKLEEQTGKAPHIYLIGIGSSKHYLWGAVVTRLEILENLLAGKA